MTMAGRIVSSVRSSGEVRNIHDYRANILIFVGIQATAWIAFVSYFIKSAVPIPENFWPTSLVIPIGSAAILLFDRFGSRIRKRISTTLAGVIVAAALAAFFGYRVSGMNLTGHSYSWISAGEIGILVTFVWVFVVSAATTELGMSNDVPLFAVSCASLMVTLLVLSESGAGSKTPVFDKFTLYQSMAVTGTCVGLLASALMFGPIVLRKAGAATIGFCLGCISIASPAKKLVATSVILPLVVMATPIIHMIGNVVYGYFRRLGVVPERTPGNAAPSYRRFVREMTLVFVVLINLMALMWLVSRPHAPLP